MFLQKICSRLLTTSITTQLHRNAVRNINVNSLGSLESELINKWKQKFAEENVPEIDISIEQILDHVLGKAMPETPKRKKSIALSQDQLTRFEQLCECRVARMPIQYIVGEWDFCDLVLKMVPPVFIPRPETEELVVLILQQFDSKFSMRFLEIGCGSGAISLALLNALPKAQCVAIDQSELACKLTLENASNLKLDNRIQVFKHKLTDESELPEIEGSFDLIVSNPPYVLTKDLSVLEPEISLYEDLRALDGGIDGLKVIKSVIKLASKRLCSKGVLWLEVDPTHPSLIDAYLKENCDVFKLKFVATYKDMFEKDRFVEIMKL